MMRTILSTDRSVGSLASSLDWGWGWGIVEALGSAFGKGALGMDGNAEWGCGGEAYKGW